MGTAAPVILEEMADWVALGGGNSGIVGNADHTYGFHVAADELPEDDYSRTRDPNGAYGPYVDWDFACAGDFSHNNVEALRTRHREVLARLMRGEMPMICEFIGQPWADQPVMYWARWNGIGNLQQYTGAGHDSWSHISWYRSMVDQRAYLWKPAPMNTGVDVTVMIVRSGEAPNPERYWVGDGMYHREVSADVANTICETLKYFGAPANCQVVSMGNISPEYAQSIVGPVPLGSGGEGGPGLGFEQTVEAVRQGVNQAEDS